MDVSTIKMAHWTAVHIPASSRIEKILRDRRRASRRAKLESERLHLRRLLPKKEKTKKLRQHPPRNVVRKAVVLVQRQRVRKATKRRNPRPLKSRAMSPTLIPRPENSNPRRLEWSDVRLRSGYCVNTTPVTLPKASK